MIHPHRSKRYLAFVRGQTCVFCFRPASEAHHVSRKAGGGGVGLKGCDYLVAPLCGEHHREIHKRGMVAERGQSGTEAELWKAIALSLRAYHLQQEGT